MSRYDRRREYISGFSGSSGDAIVTLSKAALWVDSRYYLQADDQLNCDWLLMRVGQTKVPTQSEWLKSQFPSKSRLGADPKLVSASQWEMLEDELRNSTIELVEVSANLIDVIWDNHEEEYVDKNAFVLEDKYTGDARSR